MASSSGKVKKDAIIICVCGYPIATIISDGDVKGLIVCRVMNACFNINELHDLVVCVVIMAWMGRYATSGGVEP